MVERLKSLLFRSVGKIAGITVSFVSRDAMVFHALILTRKRNRLSIEASKTGISTLEELKKFIPQKCPIVINIEGWGVLVKQIESDPNGNFDNILIPENNSEFELFVHKQSESSISSIVRKEMLNKVLDDFQSLKFNVAGVSAGPCSVAILIPVIDLEGRQLVGNWAVECENHEIKEIKTLSEEEIYNYVFEGEFISSLSIGAFSLAVKYASGVMGNESINDNLNTSFAYRRLSFFSLAIALVLLFIGLFVNFILFDNYNKEYEQVTREYLRNETLIKELKSAEAELIKRRQIITGADLEGSSHFAWYADRMVVLMPTKIAITRLAFQPADRRIQPGKEVLFLSNTVLLEGETTDVLQVHLWISNLKKEKWVVDVEMGTYSRLDDAKSGSFTLELKFDER